MIVAGVMSGTSADGIDVAIAEITGAPAPGRPRLRVAQRAFATVSWPDDIRALIFDLFAGKAGPDGLCRANFLLGETFARAVLEVLNQAGMTPDMLDLIGSHGQTVWHDVAGGRVTSTLQIGEPAVLAARTGVTTVANFRVADVAVGGQGAPLVSTFDWHMLRPPPKLNRVEGGWRAVQNIGGIGNVTLLPPPGVEAPPLAFDTGPGNVLLDWAAAQATGGQLAYDRDGALARQGRVDESLVARWLAHPYFRQQPPKTTGRELFSTQLAGTWQREATAAGLSPAGFVATLTALTAASIADAYDRYAPGPVAQVVVGGGGARNPALMAELKRRLATILRRQVDVCTHEALGIDADAKEALAFALLAYLCVTGKPGNVPACTGATRPQLLGQIAPGANFQRLLLANRTR